MSRVDTLPPDIDADIARRFGGVARLYGAAAYERFVAAHIAVVGVGGVGSWAAEALARCGVGAITLIDLDHIAQSNTNRQVHALGDEYGKAKVEAMAARIRAINPRCRVTPIEEFVSADNAAALVRGVDQVIDCIDQVAAKAALLAACRDARIAAVACGAAGGRVDPVRIQSADLARANGDPLLAKLRYRLRRDYGFPRARAEHGKRSAPFGITAIFSDEPVRVDAADVCAPQSGRGAAAPLSCAGYGSSVAVTAPLGFAAAAAVLNALAARQN